MDLEAPLDAAEVVLKSLLLLYWAAVAALSAAAAAAAALPPPSGGARLLPGLRAAAALVAACAARGKLGTDACEAAEEGGEEEARRKAAGGSASASAPPLSPPWLRRVSRLTVPHSFFLHFYIIGGWGVIVRLCAGVCACLLAHIRWHWCMFALLALARDCPRRPACHRVKRSIPPCPLCSWEDEDIVFIRRSSITVHITKRTWPVPLFLAATPVIN